MIRILVCLLALSSFSLAFGQLDSNSVTVTISSNATLQPDQVVFYVSVTAPLTTSLDEVVTALAGTGITQANLVGASNQLLFLSTGNQPGTVSWTFRLLVLFSQMKATVAVLNAAQQNPTLISNGIRLSFSVQGTQVSSQLQQSQTCSTTGLLVSARTKAQNLVTIAGLTLGNILAMSSPPVAYACSLTVKFQLMR